MKKKSEKRKDERYKCLVPVESKKGTGFDSSQTVDISKNGIGFISPKSVSPNEKIAVEIVLSPETEPVLVMGLVKWVQRLSDSDQYRIGMTFADVLRGSKSRLNKYLAK